MGTPTGTPRRVAPARPTFAVGAREDPSLAQGLTALRIHENADGLYSCEATFGNWGAKDGATTFLYFDRRLLNFGRELTIRLSGETIFRGRVSGLEAAFPEGGRPRLTVLAEDRYQDLRMTRRSRTFADVTDADVVTRVAADHGLTPDVRLTGPTYRVLAQLNQSDLAFLRDRARAVDAELWMDGSTLTARSRADRGSGSLRLGYGNELREFTVLADLAGQRSSVTVSGWDVAAKQALAETADDGILGGELGGGQSGAKLLATALGERPEQVVHSVPFTGGEARSRAESLYRRIARRFLIARGVAQTLPGLRVGARVRLEHLGELFSGDYYVTEVTHLFDDEQGLRTEFSAERAGLGGGGG
ncbi:phage late control D family protein [Nonomuraea sp. NPDC003707]